MSWTQVSQLAAHLSARHQPQPRDVAMGATFLAQSITELLTPMAA